MSAAPYDLTADLHRMVAQLSRRAPQLSHIDPERVLVTLSVARSSRRSGVTACCIPLRFDDGERRFVRGGRTWEWPPLIVDGREMLYCLNFTVPRFLDLPREPKVETVVHELFHISPRFDGSLRRLGNGRHAHHGKSREFYDRLIEPIWKDALGYLKPADFPFLNGATRKLKRLHGTITGTVARRLRPREVKSELSPAPLDSFVARNPAENTNAVGAQTPFLFPSLSA